MNKTLKIGLISLLAVAVVSGVTAPDSADATVTIGATTVESGTSQVLTLTGNAASTWSVASGDLTVKATTNSLILESAEATADAVYIYASDTAGGIKMQSAGTTQGIDIITAATGVDGIDVTAANTTGDVFDIDAAALTTGNIINIAAPTTRTTGAALLITDASVAATVDGELIQIDVTGTPDKNIVDIDVSGISTTSNALDITYSAAATGNAIDLNMTANLAGDAINIVRAGVATGDALLIDLGTANTTADAVVVDIGTMTSGNAVRIETAGTTVFTDALIDIVPPVALNTGDIIKIADGSTSSGNSIDITYSGVATGNAVDLDMGTNLAGQAIGINLTGARTDDGINIDDDSTGNTPVLDMNISGIRTGNAIDITYSSAAATENAIVLNMGTNVAGMAIDVNSSATGAADEGAALDVVHDGALVNTADVVRIVSTGNFAGADSHVLAIEQNTGAGQAGDYAVYIKATGTNVEGLKVDDGDVVFDENLTVTGTLTQTGAATLAGALTVNGATLLGDGATKISGFVKDYTLDTDDVTLTAADCGEVHALATDAKTWILPATVAGCTFTFINAGGDGAALVTIDPNAADQIFGTITLAGSVVVAKGANGAAVLNTKASAIRGDSMTLVGDGADGWYITASTGIWAEE